MHFAIFDPKKGSKMLDFRVFLPIFGVFRVFGAKIPVFGAKTGVQTDHFLANPPAPFGTP